jgi:diguanylate cyclase (GGDEF)-like protein
VQILIAEDDPVSRRLLEANLTRWGYEVVATDNGAAAWQVLQGEDPPRLVILDWMMPELDGLMLCQQVRQHIQEPYIYIVFLTAKHQKEALITGLEAGADDYLTKPFDPYELRARLQVGRRILDLQADLIAAREALRIQATKDPLTGIWNRTAILEILERELTRARREGASVAVLIADLDHFKSINDTYGHLAGDTMLRVVTQRMCSAIRSYDSVGRYGGEEFLIILPGCDTFGAMTVAERIRLQVSTETIKIEKEDIAVTLSLGVSASDAIPERDAIALIRAADAALYRAKNDGRNRSKIATDPSYVVTA